MAFAMDLRSHYIVLVIYDVTETKRRNRLITYLEQYTVRVQKSAFQGILTGGQCKKILDTAKKFIDPHTDSLRIYWDTSMKIRAWGRNNGQTGDVIIC